MARSGRPLDVGDPMPPLAFDTVAHGPQALPRVTRERREVLLVTRAHW